MYGMIGYKKKGEFFETQIDALELECKDYKLTRLSGGAMQLTSGNLSQVQYGRTIIVKDNVQDRIIKLNTDGYYTVTSKKWINEFLPRGFTLYQKNFEWFISKPNGEVIEFTDNMTIKY